MSSPAPRIRIITAHPDDASLTASVARGIAEHLTAQGAEVSFENLALSGFDPRFTAHDLEVYRGYGRGEAVEPPADIAEQQRMLEQSHALVLVFPVHWWSVPAQLKGWFDRVLTGGWAYEPEALGRERGGLAHLAVHTVPLAGSPDTTYEKREYYTAFRAQIEQGVLQYNSVRSSDWTWLHRSQREPEAALARVDAIAQAVLAGARESTVTR